MKENVTEDVSLVTVPAGGGARHDDRLRVDHLSHHSAGTVRGAHQDWAKTQLRGGDLLQTPEQNI